MKKLFVAVLAVFLLQSAVWAAGVKTVRVERPQVEEFLGYVPNTIVVKFDEATFSRFNPATLKAGRTGVPAVDRLGSKLGVVLLEQRFPKARPTYYNGRRIDLRGWFRVKFAGKVDVESVVQQYKRLRGVIDAQPIGVHTVLATPNDDHYADQWHLNQDNDHDVDAPEAWDIETGDEQVIVSILDTGVRYFHKDLGGANASYDTPTDVNGNMWINWAEKNGVDGVDDDGNGYVDDWIGWDFVDDAGDFFYPVYPGEDGDDPDNDPRDFNGHGTHCAGNIAAMNNNGYATASVSGGWGDGSLSVSGNGVKVMALRIGYSASILNTGIEVGLVRMDYAADAFYYAADNGARIASCSWGSDNSGGLGDAIDYFLSKGGLIFKAAGNDGNTDADYMCARDDIISVAATNDNDCKADFSNYGTWVDISAPGVGIWSLYHNHDDPESDYVASMDGTSMATPIAASVAALIWSKHPDWSADQVKQRLFDSADDIDNLSCNSSYAGKLGAGRVNAYNAVNEGGANPPNAAFSADPTSGCAPLTVNFTDESTGDITSWSWDFGDGSTSTEQNPTHTYNSAGSYTVSLTVTGPGGSDTETKADYITVTDVPNADFVGDPTSGTAPLTVSFTDQSTGNPTSWSWDFGDGSTSTEQNPTHTYNAAGTYTVKLTASNSCGSDTETKVDYITVNESSCDAPVADFTGSPTSGEAPLTVTFTDQSTNNPTSWSWDFGDGGTSTEQNPVHTYNSAGTYTVKLTATNDCGSDTETKVDYITVTEPSPSNVMHVAAVNVTKQAWFFVTRGKADVQIVDQDGNPVEGATVTGDWSDGATETDEFTTGSDGWGTTYTSWRFGDADYTFCVTDVSKDGWTYDPDANVETCGSTSGSTAGTNQVSNVDIEQVEKDLGQKLIYNSPNPFNPTTTIYYVVPKAMRVRVDVFNVLGKRVRTLYDGVAKPGLNSVTWDATDERGSAVGSGLYFYSIKLGDHQPIKRRMLLLK